VRTGVKLEKQIHGADHEMNWRAGTENILEIAGLGKACELIGQDFDRSITYLKSLRDNLEGKILKSFPTCKVNGHSEKRLPNTSSISFKDLEANTIISELSQKVAASAGAACHSDQVDVSAVLEAMKVPLQYAMGTIRFSVGRFTTKDEIDRAFLEIEKVIHKLQPQGTGANVEQHAEEIKLTQYTHGLGCACKLRPQLLEQVLHKMPHPKDKNILVGTDTADDAAVYKIDENTAIVQTVDFFTPIVDDPFKFGAIAAANSLSDIYAMGARPLFALNVVGFPSNRLPMSVLESILQGAQSVVQEAGISIIGGHTVDDTEPKFGLAVTGIVHPDKIVSNNGARPGDVLILTKPIGTGILSTALKQGLLEEEQQNILIQTMASLNKEASEAMLDVGVNACTDITGFGLLGHLMEMMIGSETSAEIKFGSIPILHDTADLAASGIIPGGTRDNFEFTKSKTTYAEGISESRRLLINDAQTSGGLLISVPEEKSEKLLELLKLRNTKNSAVIARVIKKTKHRVSVLK